MKGPMSYAHFVITRFNLRREASDQGAIDSGWLKTRFELFERFCYPTVRAQSSQNFRWLVLFDDQTPEQALERVRTYAQWPSFIPVFFPAGAVEQARQAVVTQLGSSRPRTLLTTRLDNDDGLCTSFIETVQRFADSALPTLVELPVGYVWHRDRLYLDRQERNPFSTLIEPLSGAEPFRTVYGAAHHDIGEGCRVVQACNTPGWVQVIHGGNIANRPRGVRRPMSDLSDRFSLDCAELARSERRVSIGLDMVRTIIRDGAMRAVRSVRGRRAA
jgi:hypothetical protein